MSYQYVLQIPAVTAQLIRPLGLGRTNERVGYIQETYVAKATSSWLESLERSLAQMKDYQVTIPAWKNPPILFTNDPIVSPQEAGKSSSGIRHIISQNAENKERGFSGGRRTTYSESQVRGDQGGRVPPDARCEQDTLSESITCADWCLQIQETEIDSVTDLGAFLDAQLSYFDRCREVLLQVKQDWPAALV